MSEQTGQQDIRKIINAALRVPCKPENFIRVWFEFLKPVHKLTDKEADVAAQFVIHYMELSKDISDEEHINAILFSKKTKNQICQTLGLKQPYFRTILQNLRRNKVIVNGKLEKKYVPSYVPGQKFRLMFIFDDAALSGTNNQSSQSGT